MVKAGGSGRGRGAAKAFPGVEADVVVVATCGDKRSAIADTFRDLKAEDADVKASARSRSATLRWTWPMRVPGWIAVGTESGDCTRQRRLHNLIYAARCEPAGIER